MEILLNDILQLSDDEINNGKIELNMRAGVNGVSFIDSWLSCDEKDKLRGTCAECSYWGWYGKQRNFVPGQLAFSFARLSYDEWLFISAAEIIEVPKNARAKVKVLKRFEPFYGRLIVKYNKGQTFSRYVFSLKNCIEELVVKEVLPCIYSGEKFEGYDRVHLPFRKLADVFSGKIMPTYYEALKTITGIYCLTDTKTGKLYIGSASGSGGVAQRWGNYLDSKHGDNVKLRKLYAKCGSKYFERYFTFTLIEYFGLSYDPKKIIDREKYWKDCLDTRKNGYNDN